MKTLSILFLSLFLCSPVICSDKKAKGKENAVCPVSTNSNLSEVEAKETTVTICTGKHSKRYHTSPPSKDCKGMKACKGERKKVTLSEAKKMGLTECGYCYK